MSKKKSMSVWMRPTFYISMLILGRAPAEADPQEI